MDSSRLETVELFEGRSTGAQALGMPTATVSRRISELEAGLNAARGFLRLGLDDLLMVAREFLNPRLAR